MNHLYSSHFSWFTALSQPEVVVKCIIVWVHPSPHSAFTFVYIILRAHRWGTESLRACADWYKFLTMILPVMHRVNFITQLCTLMMFLKTVVAIKFDWCKATTCLWTVIFTFHLFWFNIFNTSDLDGLCCFALRLEWSSWCNQVTWLIK